MTLYVCFPVEVWILSHSRSETWCFLRMLRKENYKRIGTKKWLSLCVFREVWTLSHSRSVTWWFPHAKKKKWITKWYSLKNDFICVFSRGSVNTVARSFRDLMISDHARSSTKVSGPKPQPGNSKPSQPMTIKSPKGKAPVLGPGGDTTLWYV